MTKEHKLLQLFYAGVLADSVKHYDNAGILDTVTASKLLQQQKAASAQLKQLEIDTIEGLFNNFSQIFGCIEWKTQEFETGFIVTGNKCLLCNIAKSMGIVQPCTIYCINPLKSLVGAIKPGYQLKVSETLWTGEKCEFLINKANAVSAI